MRAPTPPVVVGLDAEVLALNRAAAADSRCETRVAVVESAGHLFEASGASEAVVGPAREWFAPRLRRAGGPP